MPDVFISHATEDQATATEVCALLEARGASCWIAPRDVAPGAVWDEAILDAIESVTAFVLILSAHANVSPFVKNELNRAFSKRKPILAFRIEDIMPGRALELFLASHQWTDGFPPPLDKKIDKLAAAIRAVVPASAGAIEGFGPATAVTTPPPRMTRLARLRSTIRRMPTRERLPWMLVGVLLAVVVVTLAFGLTGYLGRTMSMMTGPEVRFEINTPPTNDMFSFAISPDGRRLVYVASSEGRSRLWLRSLDVVAAAQPLAGTEGATNPFWSPDSRSVGFFAGSKLKRLDIGSGLPLTLANVVVGRGGTWSPDGTIVFAGGVGSDPLYRVPASGGEAVAVTKPGPGQNHGHPQFLPDGRRFLYYAPGTDGPGTIYLGSLDTPETTRLTAADTGGAYAAPGWILFVRQGALVARRFDTVRGVLIDEEVTVADGVSYDANLSLGAFSVSAAGPVIYRPSVRTKRQLTWFNRAGRVLGTWGAPDDNDLLGPRLSPDGQRVAVFRTIQGIMDVWLLDAARMVRFTSGGRINHLPVWSPDGSRIVFSTNRKGPRDLYQKLSTGGSPEEPLIESPAAKAAIDFSPDGRFLLFFARDVPTPKLWVAPMEGDRKPTFFMNVPTGGDVKLSPDGRWVAYVSNESGQPEVYVRPFPDPGGQWAISTAGGRFAKWRADGKELYYASPDGVLMGVPVTMRGATIEVGTPTALFKPRMAYGGASDRPPVGQQYDVSPDGRFLVNVELEEAKTPPITIVLNWSTLSKK